MLFSNNQKKLILEVLEKERKRMFSKHKGELLDKTIADLRQTLRNEIVNSPKTRDKSIDWGSRNNK